MAIVDANLVPAQAAAEALSEPAQPVSAPDLSSFTKEQLAEMLNGGNVGIGGSAAQGSNEVAPPELNKDVNKDANKDVNKDVKPEENKTLEKKPELIIPDKFKNPDGTINMPALLKSYGEAEKVVGRQLNVENQIKQLAEQNQALQQKLEELSQPQEAEPEIEKTAEEIAAMTSQEFKAYNDKQIEAKFQAMLAKQELDQKITQSINEVAKLEGAKELEPEITKMLQSEAFQRHPDSPRMAYYAALGEKAPMLVSQARSMGYSEGYAKAKEELSKGVDSGKASAPIEAGNLSEAQLWALSKEELGKLVPRYE